MNSLRMVFTPISEPTVGASDQGIPISQAIGAKTQPATRRERDRQASEKQRLQIEAQQETRDYNINTSLKSYIDPRIYYDWGKRVDYDWKKYYAKTLQSKFSWVEDGEEDTVRAA